MRRAAAALAALLLLALATAVAPPPAVADAAAARGLAAVEWLPRPVRSGEGLAERIARLPAGGVVMLAPGTWVLDAPLRIERDAVRIAGVGAERTALVGLFDAEDAAVLDIRGAPARVAARAGDCLPALSEGPMERWVRVEGAPPPPGTVVALRAPNDEAFLDAIDSRVWRERYPYLRWTMARVVAREGHRLLLDRPVGRDMPETTRLCPVDAVEDVRVSDLTVAYRPDAPADPDSYANDAPNRMVDGVRILAAADVRLERVRIVNAGRHPLQLDETLDTVVADVALCGALNKGRGGTGYLRLARTRGAWLERVRVRGLRHVAIQWSAHRNRLVGLDSDTGVDFHGGWTRDNLVSGQVAVRAGHPFPRVRRTGPRAHWAPPGGPGDAFESAPAPPTAVTCPPIPPASR